MSADRGTTSLAEPAMARRHDAPGPTSRSGRTNRVTPDGRLTAVASRGLLWGNRGALLDQRGQLARHSRGHNWIVCELEFHDRHRAQWQPGRLTELYFLDEATALTAGHRPCGECRHAAYSAFKTAWATAHPDDAVGARSIDARLHRDRLAAPAVHRSYPGELAVLPDGVFVRLDRRPWLVFGAELLGWTFSGYATRRPRPTSAAVGVMTPRSTVATLTAGYRPLLHPSALAPDAPAREPLTPP